MYDLSFNCCIDWVQSIQADAVSGVFCRMIDFNTTGGIVVSSPYTPPYNPSSDSSDKDQKASVNTENNSGVRQTKDAAGKQGFNDLTPEEIQELTKLKQRDREVKTHEQAHMSAGGQYVRGGAHYEYQKGPDGKNYAVGGEVQIDTSKVANDPEATAMKMQAIRRAAMAPASPSPQDRRVAARATQIENRMRTEILLKRYEESDSFETGKAEAKPSGLNNPQGQINTPGANISFFV